MHNRQVREIFSRRGHESNVEGIPFRQKFELMDKSINKMMLVDRRITKYGTILQRNRTEKSDKEYSQETSSLFLDREPLRYGFQRCMSV